MIGKLGESKRASFIDAVNESLLIVQELPYKVEHILITTDKIVVNIVIRLLKESVIRAVVQIELHQEPALAELLTVIDGLLNQYSSNNDAFISEITRVLHIFNLYCAGESGLPTHVVSLTFQK